MQSTTPNGRAGRAPLSRLQRVRSGRRDAPLFHPSRRVQHQRIAEQDPPAPPAGTEQRPSIPPVEASSYPWPYQENRPHLQVLRHRFRQTGSRDRSQIARTRHHPSTRLCTRSLTRSCHKIARFQWRGPKAGGSFPLEFHRGAFASKSLATFQPLQIRAFTVWCAIFPTTKEDANPFVRKSSDDGVPRFALCALLLVVIFRPGARSERMHGPFLKSLSQKLWTSPAPMHPALFAAAGEHGCNPAVALQFTGALITVALRAERSDQSWGERRTHSG